MSKKILTVSFAVIVSMFCVGLFNSNVAHSAEETIKIAHPNVPEHPMGKAFIKFKEMVEKRSNGEIQVRIFDSSKYGDYDDVVNGLQTGALEMGSASTPNLAPFTNKFLIYDMPFLIPSYEAADQITDGPIGREAVNALEGTGILGLGYIEIGFRHLFNSKRAVESLDDANGLKIRSTSSKAHIATLEAIGYNPTPIAWSEVYTALQQQTVDGIDIDLCLAWHNNFQEVTDYLTLIGSIYSPHLVMISQKFYKSLTPQQQILITDAFTEMKLYERRLIRQEESKIVENLQDKEDFQVIKLTPEQRKKWKEATSSVYKEFEDRVSGELLNRAREAVEGYEPEPLYTK